MVVLVVLEDNKISEIGNHNQLIESNGYYKKLFDKQKSCRFLYENGSFSIVF